MVTLDSAQVLAACRYKSVALHALDTLSIPSTGGDIAMAGYFELKMSGSQYMFNLKSGNHEVILTSERYASKQGAQGGIDSVKANAPHDSRYQRKVATNGSPYFVLVATNGETLGRSEMYSSTSAMENGIASVKGNAPGAPTKDQT